MLTHLISVTEGIDVSNGVTLTRKKTLINYRPEEGRYEDNAALLFLSRAAASASLGRTNGDGG